MLIQAIAILSVGLLMFFVSLPLVYRKVPMNQIYGIRIPAAFESEQRWYDINAYGGRQMAAWAWLIVAAGVAGFFVPDGDASIYTPVSTVVVLLAILIPLFRIIQWSRRLPPEAIASQTPQVVPSEMPQAADVPLSRVLVGKNTLISAFVLGLLCVGYLIFVAHSAVWLPARVATHFDAAGRPNGWMRRETYLHFIAILGLALAAGIGGLGVILAILQARRKTSRRGFGRSFGWNRNLSFLCGDMLWLACLLLCFVAGTHYLTIEANRSHPAHLPPGGFAVLMACFIAGNIGWIALLCFHLMKKPAPRD